MIRHDASSRPVWARPWWLPGGIVGFGLVLLYGSSQLGQTDTHSHIGPGLFVTIIGIALVVLGIALGVQIARGASFAPSECEDAEADGPMKVGPFLTAVAATAAPLVLMQPAGFPVTAAVVFAGVARAFGSERLVLDLVTGAVLGTLAWFFFAWLGVNLGPFFPPFQGF
jgi:putative tricarboxylic transport membrane protein